MKKKKIRKKQSSEGEGKEMRISGDPLAHQIKVWSALDTT